MSVDPSKPRRPRTVQEQLDALEKERQRIIAGAEAQKRDLTAQEREELAQIARETMRLLESAQDRAERLAREEASGLTGEELDFRERAEDAGLTPAELEARDQAERDEMSGMTGEQLDDRDRRARQTPDSGGTAEGGGSSDGSGSGGSSGGDDGDGDGGSGPSGGGGSGGDEMSEGGEGTDDNPHGGGRLVAGNLGAQRFSGLEAALAHASGGVTDPNPEAAEGDDDNPKRRHTSITAASSEAWRGTRVVEPHSDPRVTDPLPDNS